MRIITHISTPHAIYEVERFGEKDFTFRAAVIIPLPSREYIQRMPTDLPTSLRVIADHIEQTEKTVSAVVTELFPSAGGSR